MHIEREMQILLGLHFLVRLLNNGIKKFYILLKLEIYVCFVAYSKRGNSACEAKEEGEGKTEKGKRAERVARGERLLLEGSTDRAALERLGWAVVVHHAACGVALSREEQGTEFGHLLRADADWVFADNPGNALIQRWCGQ